MNHPRRDTVTLSIIIPAYNEEDAIAGIIERCLHERENIVRETPVEEVEIIVVNDGSHDKTAEIAGQFKEISLISYAKNRGYGAAIKTGFEKARGTIVSFLDADGTCDPRFFSALCNKLLEEEADIVIGSRMTPESKMPTIRRIGNLLYATLINLLGKASITDSASGMRVIKKSSLKKLYPLPDGLHFTPAMSCRAVLDEGITIAEVPIAYQERKGTSKLNVLQDGIRFLKTIIDIALVYEPLRFFGSLGLVLLLLAFGYGFYPLFYYMGFKVIPDYMIYRLITIATLVFTSFTMFTIGIISEQISDFIMNRKRARGALSRLIYFFFSQKKLIIAGPAVALSGVVINYNTIVQYFSMGEIHVHWVYIVTGAFLFLTGVQALALGILERILRTLKETNVLQGKYLRHLNEKGE